MYADFSLEETTLEEYNRLCEKHNTSPYDKKRGRPSRKKKYFRILNPSFYTSLNELLEDNKSDDARFIKNVWIPRGLFRPSKARRYLSSFPGTYFFVLKSYVHMLEMMRINDKRIAIESVRRNYPPSSYDSIEFGKVEDLWMLRRFHIRHHNFDLYDFKGVEDGDLSGIYAISGIYDK